MSFPVPFFIYDAGSGAPLAGVVPTFQQYKRFDSDNNVTDLTGSAPVISDKGGGLYEFTIPDSDLVAGSIIAYVIDCTAQSAARYQQDSVRSDAALEVIDTTTPSTINTFSVDAEAVRKTHFPNWTPFSASTNPTVSTITTWISEEAADLAGALRVKSVDPTSLIETSSEAYAWCAKTLKLMVAVRVYPAVTNSNPDGLKPLQTQLDNRLAWLEKHGLELGGAQSLLSTSPEGPTSHISQYGLTTDDQSCMSTTRAPFHKDDML